MQPVAGDDTGRIDLDRLDDRTDKGITFDANGVLTVADGASGVTETGGGGATTYNADLLNNDRDPDGTPLTIIGVGGYTLDADGTYKARTAEVAAGTATLGSSGGTFSLKANGAWTFDHGGDFDDLADGKTRTTSVTYTVSDGGLSDTKTLTVTVTGGNDEPVAVDDTGAASAARVRTVADGDTGVQAGGTGVNADLLLNDEDADGDTLSISGVSGFTDVDPNDKTRQPQNVAAGAETYGKNGGVFIINDDGSWSFDPDGDFDDLTGSQTRTTSVGLHHCLMVRAAPIPPPSP